MQRFLSMLTDSAGTPMSGVTVTVNKAGTASAASLWADDGGTTKANPFTNDVDGTLEFYAKNGRYDLVFTKAGITFTDANSSDIVLWDPRDDSAAVVFRDDFLAPTGLSVGNLVSDGHHYLYIGGVGAVIGTTTYRNGWLDVVETGGTQGAITAGNGTSIALSWVPSSDIMMLDMRIEKVGDAVAGTRRCGLSSAVLSSGDPANGIYIRQIDANNAFLVCRATSSESTQDLGQTLNNPTRIRVTITTASVRAFVDDVPKTAITTNIPTAILGLSAAGGATASAAGLRLDYLNVYQGVRV
jgi:hypothetical protein